MAKEALFNILDNRVLWEDVQVLDLFAGTGSISLEFLSRGVANLVSVESHLKVIKHLGKIKDEWEIANWSILRKDAFKFIKEATVKYDIVFADPPFVLDKTETLPDLVVDHDILKDDGLFILEHGQENSFSEHPHFQETRRYGGVFFSFFVKPINS